MIIAIAVLMIVITIKFITVTITSITLIKNNGFGSWEYKSFWNNSFFLILTEIVLSSFDIKLFIFLGQKMKSLPDTPNVMKPCWVTDSF